MKSLFFLYVWAQRFLMLWCVLGGGVFSIQAAPPLSPEQQIERLEKKFSRIQESLAQLKQNLTNRCVPASPIEGVKPRVKIYFSAFMNLIQDTGLFYLQGLQDLGISLRSLPTFSQKGWIAIGLLMGKFVLSIVLALTVAGFTKKWLHKPLRKILNRNLDSTPSPFLAFSQWSLELLVSLLPVFLGLLIQIGTFFVLEHNPLLRGGMASLTTGLWFWASVWQIQQMLLRHAKQIPLLRYMHTPSQRSLVYKVQIFLFFWIVGDWSVDLAILADLPFTAQKVLSTAFSCGMVVAFVLITHLLKRPIFKTFQFYRLRAPSTLTLVFTSLWNAFAFCVVILFVLNDTLLKEIFWPLFWTALLLPLVPLLGQFFRQWRIPYVWRFRHQANRPLWFRLLKSHRFTGPLFYLSVYIVVWGGIIRIWGIHPLNFIRDILGEGLYNQIIEIILLVFGIWVCISLGDRLIDYWIKKAAPPSEDTTIEQIYLARRLHTLLTIARTLLRVVVCGPFGLLILATFGYNITPLLTSLGVLSAILGFGLQSLVKDVFTGFFIILDNSLIVGDSVEIEGKRGTVEGFSLRTLKVRADNGTLLFFPFGNISVIGNRSRHFAHVVIDVAVPYDADPDRITALLEKAYQVTRRTPICGRKILSPIEVRGITEVNDYAFVVQARIKTAPGEQDMIRRAFNRILKNLFDEAGIRIPSPPTSVARPELSPSLTNTKMP